MPPDPAHQLNPSACQADFTYSHGTQDIHSFPQRVDPFTDPSLVPESRTQSIEVNCQKRFESFCILRRESSQHLGCDSTARHAICDVARIHPMESQVRERLGAFPLEATFESQVPVVIRPRVWQPRYVANCSRVGPSFDVSRYSSWVLKIIRLTYLSC
jgi:hypothetical protein